MEKEQSIFNIDKKYDNGIGIEIYLSTTENEKGKSYNVYGVVNGVVDEKSYMTLHTPQSALLTFAKIVSKDIVEHYDRIRLEETIISEREKHNGKIS